MDEALEGFWTAIIQQSETKGFQVPLGFRTVAYGEGRAQVEVEVTAAHLNLRGDMHGGAIATLIDWAGTIAIVTGDREHRAGVTTDLSISYLRGAPPGARLRAEATLLKAGGAIAFVDVTVYREDAAIVARGRMTKYLDS